MRAIVITEPGSAEVLEEEERPIPEPRASQIRVRVKTSGLNRADLLQRRGMYPPPNGAPADIPGLEYAGEVEAVGPGAGLWAVGSRVMGIVGGGSYAEFLCVHEREAIRIPHGLDWDDAAAIPEAFLTAYDALFRQMDLEASERVLIHAVGSGVGTAAVQLARAFGAITYGTSRTPEKLDAAKKLGLQHGFDASDDDWVEKAKAATDGEGINVVLDLVGGHYVPLNLRLLAPRGRAIIVGTIAGSRAEVDFRVVMQKRLRIAGTVLRSRPLEEKIQLAREFSDSVLPLFSSGQLRPVIDRVYPFAEVVEAHRAMEENRSFGKIVLKW
ncbi:MAG: zinc-binding dehydrogenase [Gemmatimonas sp.]|nr:zinc-binding dehydrogenase [Gemmatimonas sp.]